ncbi:MAG: hypothetical protein AAFQ98_23995 [Bacteroidota bacterium]
MGTPLYENYLSVESRDGSQEWHVYTMDTVAHTVSFTPVRTDSTVVFNFSYRQDSTTVTWEGTHNDDRIWFTGTRKNMEDYRLNQRRPLVRNLPQE